MTDLLAGPRTLDAILLLMALEGAALLLLFRRTGRGVAPGALLGNLAAGGFLLLALRFSLAGAGAAWVAACLGLALLAHLADLRARWRA